MKYRAWNWVKKGGENQNGQLPVGLRVWVPDVFVLLDMIHMYMNFLNVCTCRRRGFTARDATPNHIELSNVSPNGMYTLVIAQALIIQTDSVEPCTVSARALIK